MGCKLTDRIVKSLPLPKQGNRISYDSEVAGFGARVTSGGSRAFILNYYTRIGREPTYAAKPGQAGSLYVHGGRVHSHTRSQPIRGPRPLCGDRSARTGHRP